MVPPALIDTDRNEDRAMPFPPAVRKAQRSMREMSWAV
jgi:hypothetical protein